MTSEASIYLSGPMGSGKSTLARALAGALGWHRVDLDEAIEVRAGMTIRQFFQEHGEGAFRRLEREELERILARETEPFVFSLGGGTVLDPQSRRRLLASGLLLTLEAPVEVLTNRVAEDAGRPLLMGKEARAALLALLRDRAPAYAECHRRVRTDRPLEEVVAEIEILRRRRPVAVPLGERSYTVEVGRGALAELEERTAPFSRALVVTDKNVASCSWAKKLLSTWCPPTVVLEPGEIHKDLGAVERIWNAALAAGLDRGGLVVALGGGVVGDLAGFAAATYLRGVAFAQVPTTLLAMVDSSVGGKTGFDRPEGKNLIGAFHQPSFVLCDPETLATLDDRELRAGLAEVVKSAWLAGEDFVAFLEENASRLLGRDHAAIEEAVRRSVELKTAVVVEDEREAGRRRLLNLGHTVGHALEAAGAYTELLHGEAVALGLVAALRLSEWLGEAELPHVERGVALLGALGLPVDLERYLHLELRSYLARDKKRAGDTIAFILPRGPGDVEVRDISLDELERGVRSLR